VRDAADRVARAPDVTLLPPTSLDATSRKAATLDRVRLPYGVIAGESLDIAISGGQRIGLTGENGSGKSTLFNTIAGRLAPAGGSVRVHVPMAFLDQQLTLLDARQSPLEQLLAANPGAPQADLRTRLALIGLAEEAALQPVGNLSGGERLKTALAYVLYRDDPAELLLLDEPTNHLDLRSLEALEQTLQDYRGALLVASHDRVFLDRIGLQYRIELAEGRWLMTHW
jgi:ATPase subunit of ABC transporter with duplicated ATPase domains